MKTNERRPFTLRTFPDSLAPYLEAGSLPEDDNQELQKFFDLQVKQTRGVAALRNLQSFIQTKGKPTTITTARGVVHWKELPFIKNDLNNHIPSLKTAYSTFPEGWSWDEMVKIAGTDPYFAWCLASAPNAPIQALQNAASQDAEYAYHFGMKHRALANVQLAIDATRPNPFWHFYALKNLLQEPHTANDYIYATAPYTAEAAATWIRTQELGKEPPTIITRRLLTSPKWCCKAAYDNTIKPNPDISTLWEQARQTAMTDPQWAYHWLALVEPHMASEFHENVAVHPGWWCQLIQDLPQTTEEEKRSKLRLIQQGGETMKVLAAGANPNFAGEAYFRAMVVWITNKLETINLSPNPTN